MKGKMTIGLLILVMGLTLVGCTTNKNDNKEIIESGDTESNTLESESIVWEEVTISVPKEWEDKVLVIKSDDCVSIYQESSYKKEKGSGFLYEIYKTKEFTNNLAGEQIIAFTDSDLYVASLPTDVSCYYEDEKIKNEYMDLIGQTDKVSKSIKIDNEGVHYNVDEYVIPTSSTILLTENSLLDFNDNDLWLARNEIYARHGREFDNYFLQNYFDSCSWYQGKVEAANFDDTSLNKVEKSNLTLIKKFEDKYKQEHSYPSKQKVGSIVNCDLNEDGNSETINYVIKENKQSEQGGGGVQPVLEVEGKVYDLSEIGRAHV